MSAPSTCCTRFSDASCLAAYLLPNCGSPCFRSPALFHPEFVVGGPRLPAVALRSDGGAGRPNPRSHGRTPTHSGPVAVIMPSPLMNIWDATFKEKGAAAARISAACMSDGGEWVAFAFLFVAVAPALFAWLFSR